MEAIQCLVLYAFSMATMMGALYLEKSKRPFMLIPTWTLLALSLKDINHLPAFFNLNALHGMLIIVTLLWAPILFTTYSPSKHLDLSKPYYDLPAAFRLWNNPRMLVPLSPQKIQTSQRRQFAVQRTLQATLILAIRTTINHLLNPYRAKHGLHDFAPAHESLFHMLIAQKLTPRALGIRTHVSLSWIFDTYTELTLFHIGISLICVCLLQIDAPSEWPSLFGSPLRTFSLRAFWGQYWHRLMTPSAAVWSRAVSSLVPGLAENKKLSKLFAAFGVFTFSGLAHMLVGWRCGEAAVERDLFFFWANFGAIAVEIAVEKAARNVVKRRGEVESKTWRVARRLLGYLWVVCFFVIAIPHLLYPKIHAAIRAQMFKTMFEWGTPV